METYMNEKRGISWLSLYMYAYLIVGTIVLSNTSLGGEIPDEYKNNLTLFWGEKACIISVCGLALYNFLALFRRWPNAVQISNTYLGVIILLNGLNLLLGDINTSNTEEGQKMARSIIAIVTAVTWILYFKKSNEINALFPRGERRLFGRDVLIICAAIAIPPILLLLGVSNKDEGFKSVMGDINIEEEYIEVAPIDKSKLKDGEITDGIAIFTVPDGVLYEVNNGKVTLSDSKSNSSYTIDMVSSDNMEVFDYTLSQVWEDTEPEGVEQLTPVISYNNTYPTENCRGYRKIAHYYPPEGDDFVRDCAILYDAPTKKACVILAYYKEGNDTLIDEIIKGIRFRQE